MMSTSASAATPVRLLWYFGSCLGLLTMLLLLSTSSLLANGEFYSSVDSLKRLDSIESSLLLSFRTYSEALQDDLATIRRFMERIKFQHKKAEEDVEDYLGNPINAFTLIERVVRDWGAVDNLLKFEETTEALTDSLTQLRENSTLPDESELKGAIMGLARLQDIYDVTAEDMANGKGYGYPLSWRECFEIATTFTDELRADLALSWLQEAYAKLQSSQDTDEIKAYFTIHIKEHLAMAHQTMGEHENAIQHLDEVLAVDPQHPTRLTKKLLSRLPAVPTKYKPSKESDRTVNYAKLCQGLLTSKESKQLNCRLDSTVHPFFTIAPLKIEPVHLDPQITLYHNLLNDEQISKLVQHSDGTLKRSMVMKSPGQSVASENRVSQQTWVTAAKNPTAAMMYRVLGLISGFNMTNTEQMQVANYGIGGQYVSHHDYFHNTTSAVPGLVGDRFATNMFYISDVAKGGYTIFPRLNVYLKPIKGTMVMWYNLHKSLAPDDRTLHGGCPVLKGSKRIANIWSRSGFQDIVRPCDLENNQ